MKPTNSGLQFCRLLRIPFLLLILIASVFSGTTSFAQAPTITTNIGIPTGSANGRGVAYGNGVYVCILSSGSVYTSPDGDSWTKTIDAGLPAGTYNRIAFGAGLFVIVGHNGMILSSPDGLTWTSRTSGTTNHLYDIQFIASSFYAIGANTTLRSSTDGITWNTVTIGTGTSTHVFQSITYGNGKIVIGARTSGASGNHIYYSSTGASNSWSYVNIGVSSINRVQYLKDKFFLFCSNTNVFTSTNASSWTNSTASLPLTLPNMTTQTIGSPNQIFNGIYDGTKIYLFGSSQYHSGYGSIFSSSDGVNFTLEPKTAYIVCQGSAYINGKYFQYGNEGIISSDDGLNYKYPSGNYYGMASSGTSYVGVGTVGQSGIIFTSSDFNTWTEKTPSGQKELNAVTYNGSKYLAVGKTSVVESTDNGATWSQIATPPDVFAAVAYGSGRFVAGGYDNSTYAARIAYSADGTSWTTANTDDNYYFRIKVANGNFFALGYSNASYEGVILYSTDGVSWSDITPSIPFSVYYYNDVVYDGSKYHFMGVEWANISLFEYGEFFSISTATVTNPASFANKGTITTAHPGVLLGGTFGEGAFAYSNGRFAGSVIDEATYQTYIVYSTNGVDWTSEALDAYTLITGIVAEGDDFKMMGSGDGKIGLAFGSITLPVNLTDFNAVPENGQSILNWKTASEQNSQHFIIQHSTNQANWRDIGMVAAAGQSQESRQYQFVHTNPAEGYNYYRLIQTDMDGKQQISPIRLVHFGKSINIRLYPNPAREWVRLDLPSGSPATITLFNTTGQQVYSKQYNSNSIQLSLEHLPRGSYKVVVQQNGEKIVTQLNHL